MSIALWKISDLLEANKLVRDMRRNSDQVLKFHTFKEMKWDDLVVVQWGDASEKSRPDGSQTGGLVTGISDDKFYKGLESEVTLVNWRSFKLPRKIQGSNNAETQAMSFADETLWLTRLMWSEVNGVFLKRWWLTFRAWWQNSARRERTGPVFVIVSNLWG